MTTPMRQQYLRIKKQYPETIVFFRLGDFYETFDDDAKLVAQVCDIVLTSRPVGKDQRVPLAGVPYHAVEGYIAKLIQAGHKVAIVEQVGEVPGQGPGGPRGGARGHARHRGRAVAAGRAAQQLPGGAGGRRRAGRPGLRRHHHRRVCRDPARRRRGRAWRMRGAGPPAARRSGHLPTTALRLAQTSGSLAGRPGADRLRPLALRAGDGPPGPAGSLRGGQPGRLWAGRASRWPIRAAGGLLHYLAETQRARWRS